MRNILKVLIIAKQEFKQIPKNSYNPYHKSKYANLDALLEAISESFNKYNYSTNVRSLSWQQIEQLKIYIKTEGKNRNQSPNPLVFDRAAR